MNINQPDTVTNTAGKEAIKDTTSQGYVVGDGTTDRVLLGFQKDGFGTGNNFGIKVSQSGYDVKTATNSQLAFNSSQNVFKIVQTGTITVGSADLTWTTTNQWKTNSSQASVAHGLGYIPIVIGVLNFAGHYNKLPVSNYVLTGVAVWFTASIESDATNIYFNLISLGNSLSAGASTFGIGGYTAKYYILQETAN